MKDVLHTEHIGCGGIFREINIYEDIRCNKCNEPSERYFYTKKEQLLRANSQIKRLEAKISDLEENLAKIHKLSR